MEQLSHCPLCSSTELSLLYSTRDRHYGSTENHTIAQCRECCLVFLNPMYNDEELGNFYPKNYYAYQPKTEGGALKAWLKKWLGVKTGTHDPHFATPGRMLDIGCGSGWILREWRDKGWDVYGAEPSADAVAEGRASGLPIHQGTVLSADFPTAHFDYIRSNHSFEHIPNPNETLKDIHRILKPDGRLFIGVPNIDSPQAKLFGRYWWYLGAPVHTFNYSSKTLVRMLEKNNFIVEKVRYNSDFSGIAGSLQIWLNRNNGRLSNDGTAFSNPLVRIVCQWIAQMGNALRTGDAIEVIARKKPA